MNSIVTIVMEASASPKGRAKLYASRYRKLALVDVDTSRLAALGRTEPSMISDRAKGVVAVRESAIVHKGRGSARSEYYAYLGELRTKRDALNSRRVFPRVPDPSPDPRGN